MLLFFILGYIFLTFIIGAYASRFVKNSGDFIMAGRRLPLMFNAFALFALWFGSETILGASSEFIDHGLIGIIEDPFGGALCLVLYALFFAKRLYRMNIMTLGDLFKQRYGQKVEWIASFFMVITFFGYVAAQLVALGILLHLVVGITIMQGILVSSIIVCGYTMLGGMWAVSITDFVQSILIIIGLAFAAYIISQKGGGVGHIISQAPTGFFRFTPEPGLMNYVHYLAAWSVLGLGSLPSQDIFQRVNAARSEKTAVRSTFLGAFLYLIIAALPLFIALAAKVAFPPSAANDAQLILPELILRYTTLPIQILFFGALISAILSTCSGAILAPASIISENLIKPVLKKELSEKQFLLTLRFSVLIVTLISVLFALSRNNIFELVGESYTLGLVSLLVPMVAAIYWKKTTKLGAMLSMVLGMVSWLLFEFIIPTQIPALVYGLAFSILGMLIGSLKAEGIGTAYKNSPK